MNGDMHRCMGCKNCEKFCPNGAIKIQLINGDYVQKIASEKCINCGICKKYCPFTEHSKNDYCKIYIGRIKNEELINKSSSGGIFGEIARKTLKLEWIIYGAGFNEKFRLSHKRISNIEDLDSILKSKYVKSDLSNSFRQVKEDLEKNRKIIFSGTPCQIAALKKYLNKQYDNLYTIDVICHGTPKNSIWDKYVQEIEEKFNSRIKSVDFRYNNQEETEKNYLIEFLDGQKINMSLYDSIFGKAFLQNMILSKSCYSCTFNNSNNLSDITLGDAHGYVNEEYPRKRSLIIIHTEKGHELFEQIKNNLILFEDYSKEVLANSNYPLLYSSIPHYNADNIDINGKESIIEILQLNLNNKYIKMKYDKKNVAILNFHYENYNYGANLVAYSLAEVVKKLGYIPYIIDYDPFLPLDNITRFKTKALLDFRIKNLNMTPNIYDGEELKELNKYFDNFIVGSDQVWRKLITKDNMFRYFFDFVDSDKKCISYGASFGNNIFEGTEEEKTKARALLKKFNSVSVRELDAIDIIKNDLDNDGKIVLDPTLLLTAEDYEKFNTENTRENYVAYYTLFDKEEGFLKKMQELFPDKKLVNIKGNEESILFLDKKEFKYNTMEQWISGIKNADFIVTDSYHGLLFSLIFKKEFICLGKNSKAKSRFDSLCSLLNGNIEDRIFGELNEVDNISLLKELDYETINENIIIYRKASIKFLEESLEKKIEIDQVAIDLNNYLKEIEKLKKDIEELKNTHLIELNLKINNYENNIKDLLQHSNNLNNIVKLYEKEINNITLIKNNLEIEVKKLEDKNEKLNEANKQLNNHINNIYNSKSWKLTQILRNIRKGNNK